MFAFLENPQKCRSPPPMLPRAAELPCGGATFFINPEPLAGALTSHNLVSDSNPNPQPSTPPASPSSSLLPPRMTLHHYQITGTRQRGNDSCQRALKSTPPFQLKRATSFLGPTARISLLFFFLFFLLHPVPGFTSFEPSGRKVSVFARSLQQVPTNIRCQVSRPSVTEADREILSSTSIWRAGVSRSRDKKL